MCLLTRRGHSVLDGHELGTYVSAQNTVNPRMAHLRAAGQVGPLGLAGSQLKQTAYGDASKHRLFLLS